MELLDRPVVPILGEDGSLLGSGFCVGSGVEDQRSVVTAMHVLDAEDRRQGATRIPGLSLGRQWCIDAETDLAVATTDEVGTLLPLAPSTSVLEGQEVEVQGFDQIGRSLVARTAACKLVKFSALTTAVGASRVLVLDLEIQTGTVDRGYSGSPVIFNGAVVGVVVRASRRSVMAIGTDGLIRLAPSIRSARFELSGPVTKRMSDAPARIVASTDGIVGRDNEVSDLLRRLSEPLNHQVLTLVGPAGIGKSTIAQAVCDHAKQSGLFDVVVAWQARRRPRNLALADTEPGFERCVRFLASEFGLLGAQHADLDPLVSSLRNAIGRRRCLLFLDNLEELSDISASLIEPLLGQRSRAILTTTDVSQGGLGSVQILPMPEDTMEQLVEQLFRKGSHPVESDVISSVVTAAGGIPLIAEIVVEQSVATGSSFRRSAHQNVGADLLFGELLARMTITELGALVEAAFELPSSTRSTSRVLETMARKSLLWYDNDNVAMIPGLRRLIIDLAEERAGRVGHCAEELAQKLIDQSIATDYFSHPEWYDTREDGIRNLLAWASASERHDAFLDTFWCSAEIVLDRSGESARASWLGEIERAASVTGRIQVASWYRAYIEGWSLVRTGRYSDAVSLLSLVERNAEPDWFDVRALCAKNLGSIDRRNQEYESGRRHLARSRSLFEEAGLTRFTAMVDFERGLLELSAGDPAHARRWIQLALDANRALSNIEGTAYSSYGLALTAMAESRHLEALPHLLESVDAYDKIASTLAGCAHSLLALAECHANIGNRTEAMSAAERARSTYSALGLDQASDDAEHLLLGLV